MDGQTDKPTDMKTYK